MDALKGLLQKASQVPSTRIPYTSLAQEFTIIQKPYAHFESGRLCYNFPKFQYLLLILAAIYIAAMSLAHLHMIWGKDSLFATKTGGQWVETLVHVAIGVGASVALAELAINVPKLFN